MKPGSAVLFAATAVSVGAALWAGTVRAQDREPAERIPPQQVIVQVNAPAPLDNACGGRVGYGDCGCYSPYATSVTVLDAPFRPGAMYFVNQPPVAVRHGRWR